MKMPFARFATVSRLIKTFLLVTPLALVSCAGLQEIPAASFVIEGLSSPESVAMTGDGKKFFISNLGEKLEPSAKDGDGFITEVSPEGAVVNKKFLPKSGVLNGPKGLSIIGPTLYVTDVDRVVGFDLVSREQVFEMDFSAEKTVFLNDLAVYDDNTLFVSATDIGKIFKIRSLRPLHTVSRLRASQGRTAFTMTRRRINYTWSGSAKAANPTAHWAL